MCSCCPLLEALLIKSIRPQATINSPHLSVMSAMGSSAIFPQTERFPLVENNFVTSPLLLQPRISIWGSSFI